LAAAPSKEFVINMVQEDSKRESIYLTKEIDDYISPFDDALNSHELGSVNIFGLLTSSFKQELLTMFFSDRYSCLVFLTVAPALKCYFKD